MVTIMWDRDPEIRWILPAALIPVFAVILIGFQSGVPLENDTKASVDGPDLQQATEYHADIQPLGDSGVTGKATFTEPKGEGSFKVQLNAKGLSPGTHPQHIHEGAECSEFGGVEVGLKPFPEATGGGTVSYQSQDIEKPDDLANRTVVVHATDGTPVACGPINPVSD
jgi:hypothetical protein